MDIVLLVLIIAGFASLAVAVYHYRTSYVEITFDGEKYTLHNPGNKKRFDKELEELEQAILKVGITKGVEEGVKFGCEYGFKDGWAKGCDAMKERIIKLLKDNNDTAKIGKLIEETYEMGRNQGFEQAMKSVEGLDLDAIIKETGKQKE